MYERLYYIIWVSFDLIKGIRFEFNLNSGCIDISSIVIYSRQSHL